MTIKRRFFLFNILIILVHKTLKAMMAALKESYQTNRRVSAEGKFRCLLYSPNKSVMIGGLNIVFF